MKKIVVVSVLSMFLSFNCFAGGCCVQIKPLPQEFLDYITTKEKCEREGVNNASIGIKTVWASEKECKQIRPSGFTDKCPTRGYRSATSANIAGLSATLPAMAAPLSMYTTCKVNGMPLKGALGIGVSRTCCIPHDLKL
jgi:hypothetical protein